MALLFRYNLMDLEILEKFWNIEGNSSNNSPSVANTIESRQYILRFLATATRHQIYYDFLAEKLQESLEVS